MVRNWGDGQRQGAVRVRMRVHGRKGRVIWVSAKAANQRRGRCAWRRQSGRHHVVCLRFSGRPFLSRGRRRRRMGRRGLRIGRSQCGYMVRCDKMTRVLPGEMMPGKRRMCKVHPGGHARRLGATVACARAFDADRRGGQRGHI